jgi:hypothetical protein
MTGGTCGSLRSRGDRGLGGCRVRVVLRWPRSGRDANALASAHLRCEAQPGASARPLHEPPGGSPMALAFYQAAQKSGKGEQWMSIPR